MRYYVLLLLISCAAYAAASVVTALSVASAWPRILRRTGDAASSARARALATAQLLPAAAGLAFAGILCASFIRYEPRGTTEDPGLLLVAAASLTLALTFSTAGRLVRAFRVGAECTRLLRACGRRVVHGDGTPVWLIDTELPVAAVIGIFRTRLLLSTRIVSACTPEELDAVVRHERAHVERRDNLVRAAMLYLPNPLSFLNAGRELQGAWAAAAEESADDDAAGQEIEARTLLASALIRVAKMADAPAPRWMPALAFYEGTNLERRVRRLLGPARFSNGMSVRAAVVLLALAGSCALALTGTAARALHAWMEVAVSVVP